MKSLWEPTARQELVARIMRLTPESTGRWGKMEVTQMVCHAADQLRMGLGEISTAEPHGPLRYAPMRYLLIHVLPWPKGKAKGPREAFTTDPGSWESDRTELLRLIERFSQMQGQSAWPRHPLFGKMTARDWAVLSYRHLDHHLRQFGC